MSEGTSADARDAYDRWAATYDHQDNVTRDLDALLLRAADLPLSARRVLEVGCGTGKNTEWLVAQGAQVVGLDVSPQMLAIARTKAPSADLRECDLAARWPVDDDSADVVLADLVLEHIEALAHVAQECARVVRPGGRVRISELHPWQQHRGKRAIFEVRGETVAPPAFVHSTEDYVTAYLAAGFGLCALSEPREADAAAGSLPRLLVLDFEFSATA